MTVLKMRNFNGDNDDCVDDCVSWKLEERFFEKIQETFSEQVFYEKI